MDGPFITFLSDYGLADTFVGVCHGVIARICPAARVLDLTHGVPRHDVRAGALLLAEAFDYLPPGVHLAVVDPDVGADRRAVALMVQDGRTLIGPDNGLLSLAAQAGGGVTRAVDISRSRYRLAPVSATFHGRDIFAPVAAQLAAGAALGETGTPLDPDTLISLALPPARRDGEALVARVLHVDGFGNVALNARHTDLAGTGLRVGRPASVRLPDASEHVAQYVRTFADAGPGQLLLYEDAQRRLAVAVGHGDAARRLGLAVDDVVRLGLA